jgi:aryl-alcohol dehydrogenase-like predicted oxidoreductase
MTVERFDFAPGYTISRLLKGGWHLAGGHGAIDRDQAIRDMAEFVDAGITTFDCADHYTGVEQLIGEFRRSHPALARRLQVHTKYVPDLDLLPRITRADTVRIIDRSLQRLGVERLDLVQYYWWDLRVPGGVETALVLRDLMQAGKIARLGVSNFNTQYLRALLDAGVPIVANQIQYSLVDRRGEVEQIAFCRERGIHILTYGHLLGGFISEEWLDKPEPSGPFSNRSLTKYKLIIDDFGGWPLFQQLLSSLERIGRRLGVGPGEVAVRWTLDRPGVAGVIVGATSTRHLARNLRVFSIALDEADRAQLDAICARRSGPAGDVYELESDRQGRHGRIMRYNQNQLSQAPA